MPVSKRSGSHRISCLGHLCVTLWLGAHRSMTQQCTQPALSASSGIAPMQEPTTSARHSKPRAEMAATACGGRQGRMAGQVTTSCLGLAARRWQ